MRLKRKLQAGAGGNQLIWTATSNTAFHFRRYFHNPHFIPIIVYNSGCVKREAHIIWSMVTCQGSTRSEQP